MAPFRILVAAAVLTLLTGVASAAVISDGSDGAWSGGGTLTLGPDGIFNFTTIDIPSDATLRFARNAANTPVVLAATGDVTIDGSINISGNHFSGVAGPGGGDGGSAGNGSGAGLPGDGPSPGQGGPSVGGSNVGNGGGGGGMATPGLTATSRTNSNPGPGGLAIGFAGPIGGSGGGGGSGATIFGVAVDGGVGGGAGGGLLITTPGQITLNGAILADGGHAGWAFSNLFGYGGPGGGGSGGNIMLEADSVTLGASAVISALGGAGGGRSTEPVPNDPFHYSSGAHGGQGYVAFSTGNLSIDPGATIAATMVPLPATLPLFASALAGIGLFRRRKCDLQRRVRRS